MSKFEKNTRRASQAMTWPGAQNSSSRPEYRTILALLCFSAFALILLADTAWAQLYEGEQVVTITNASWVRLRSTPEIRSDTVLTRVAGGVQLRYLGTQGEWLRVELPDGTEGWLHSEYGRLDSAHDLLEVSASIARIRETPNQDSPVIGRAIKGLMLDILEKEEPWYMVRLPLGLEGWVREDMVTLHEVQSKPMENRKASDTTVETEGEQATQVENSTDNPSETNILEISPLPISAAASSVGDKSGSPTLRSPQNLEKPKLLMLFVSVIAGLSAFAVILMLGTVAVRRRRERISEIETTEKDSGHSPPEGEVAREYSDPLLKWMSKKSTNPAASRDEVPRTDEGGSDLPSLSEPETISALEEEPSRVEIDHEDLAHSYEPAQPFEEKAVKNSVEEESTDYIEMPSSALQTSAAPEEDKIETEEPLAEAVVPASVEAEKTTEQAQSASGRRTSRSSRSRSRRKGKKRRRRN